MQNNFHILALQGKSNVGKTDTLKMLIMRFIQSGFTAIEQSKNFSLLLDGKKFNGDVQATLAYGGKTVRITTRGDTKAALERDLDRYSKSDLCICAVHTHGETVDFVKELTKNGSLHMYGKATYYMFPENDEDASKKQTQTNSMQADMLFKEICFLVCGKKFLPQEPCSK